MKISSVGKFLDQPLLSNSLARKMPAILVGSAAIFGIKDTLEKPKEERKKSAIKNAIILTTITAASLIGAKGVKIKGERLIDVVPKKEILKTQSDVIDKFVGKNSNLPQETLNILNKAKEKMLSLSDTDRLLNSVKDKKDANRLINTLFGNKENITSNKIMQEIAKLSIMGFIPVASGIAGGIVADNVVGESDKTKTTNKIKEGIYQFFANIFLCNVGAGTFLFAAEKLNEKGIIKQLTPLKKTGVILGGILAVGVLGGSCIANCIGNKIVNPLINKITGKKSEQKETRKPEALDIALHTDDIATAGVLSGVKWIEPLLPVMYLVSGYRSAIGYRNSHDNSTLDKQSNDKHN